MATAPDAERRLVAMQAALAHRGPDGAAVLRTADVCLGLTRLAIVRPSDPAGLGRARKDGRDVVIAANGEIYRHRALRSSQEAAGVQFVSGPDTTCLAAAYALDGTRGLLAVPGTFACAVLDGPTLVLARDVVGKRPLYFARIEGGVAFSSEQKALVAGGFVAPRPDDEAVARVLRTGFLEECLPLLRGVSAVAPGEVVVVEGGVVRRAVGASLQARHTAGDDAAVLDELAAAFALAARERVPDEVAGAVAFSGGVDSCLVAACAVQLPLVCVAMPERDATALARAQAARLSRPLQIVERGPLSRATLRRALFHTETPDAQTAWSLAPAMLALGDALRAAGQVVCLSGEGADELFVGYPWHRLTLALAHDVRSLAPPLTKDDGDRLDRAEGAWLVDDLQGRPRRRALSLWTTGASLQPVVDEAVDALCGVSAGFGPVSSSHELPERRAQEDALALDMLLLPVLHADRLLLAAGVEARMPFLDRDVVELALSLGPGALFHAAHEKPAVAALAAKLAPDVVVPPKDGFRGAPRPDDVVVEALLRAAVPTTEATARLLAAPRTTAAARELAWRAFLIEETLDVLAQGGAS